MIRKNKNLMWTLKSSRYLSHEPWITVRQDYVILPNGNSIPDYYVLEYPDWVNVLAVTCERKFVMIQQYRHGIGRVCFEIPAGVCEKKDGSLLKSAQRELLEETGYGKGEWQLFTTLSANTGTHTNLAYTFLATDVERIGPQSLDAGEALTVHLFEQKEVFEMLQSGEIIQSLMAAPLWKYFYDRKSMIEKEMK